MKILKLLGALVVVGMLGLGVFMYSISGDFTPDASIGTQAPDVTLASLDGQPMALSSMNDKIVLLDFWASN